MEAAPRTRRVAEFVRDVCWHELPADLRDQTIRCAADLTAVAVAGSQTRVARIMADYAIANYGPGKATIVGTGSDSTPVGAALANGFAASSLDLDDGYRPVKGHPGAVVFPAVLSAAEQTGATGTEFLTALVIGYEVAIRAGLVLHPLYGFYHGTGAWGPIGAAAGAARLLCADLEQTCHALGIADFHAPITPEIRSVDHPSMLKDGIGWGAMVGLASAQLAARGFTGIPSLFDTDSSAPTFTENLRREYLLRRLYFKPHACCRWTHPAVEGAIWVMRELGLKRTEIARVRVYTFEAAMHLRLVAPRTTEEAQFSLPWAVACALIDGAVGPEQVLEYNLNDPARRALAALVETIHDPELERSFPDRALAWVEIESSDGRCVGSEILAARGDPELPLSPGELSTKFKSLCDPVLGPDHTAELLCALWELPNAADLSATRYLQRHDEAPGAA